MNKARESSLAVMILMPLAVFIVGSVGVLLVYTKGPRLAPLLLFIWAVVIGAFFWLVPMILQRTGRGKKIQLDERDLLICKNAVVIAHTVLWLYFLAACLVSWWLVGPEGLISVNVMALVLVGGVTLFVLVQHLAAFIQYGRGDEETEKGTLLPLKGQTK
jgi:hydrogenase-4 membrane subunit HyfE